MKPPHLTPDEQVILKAHRDAMFAERLEAYHQAVIDLSPMLAWLNCTPKPDIGKLRMWIMNQFTRAAEKCPPGSTIHQHLEHYRNQTPNPT